MTVVCCIGIIIIAVIGGGLSHDKNTSPSTKSNDNSAPQAQGKQIKIIYSGEWSGAAGDTGSVNSISGSGDKTIDVDKDAHIISANAQKQDSSHLLKPIELKFFLMPTYFFAYQYPCNHQGHLKAELSP